MAGILQVAEAADVLVSERVDFDITGVPSPCRRDCRAVDGRCVGCGRTLAQIAAWSAMSNQEKLEVLATLPEHPLRRGFGP